MNFLIISSICFFITIHFYVCLEESDKLMEKEINCRERNRLITTDKGDIYMLVDAIGGKKLILQCHYCKETENNQPKIWYKITNIMTSSAQEVKLGMESNVSLNKIFVNEKHSLVFRNFSVNDTGFYYCLGLDGQGSEDKYSYFVDVVFEGENDTEPETGNMTSWLKYYNNYFAPVNKALEKAGYPSIEYIRKHLYLEFEVITSWEQWGPCEVCGRAQGAGRRRKKGRCRIKITSLLSGTSNIIIKGNNSDEAVLLNVYQVSCKSTIIYRQFPDISNATRYLPQFIMFERCDGICNPDAEGLNKGWKSGKTMDYKYKKSFVLAENAHLTLVCPESTLENVVSWYKDSKLLKPGESVEPKTGTEPRITVDTFNTLYLHGVTSEEEGNYTCQVNNIRMQTVKIFIVSKSKLLTQAFFRHMIYLAFVLSLTFSCYCAGLFITWRKRHTFKSYEQIRTEHPDSDSEPESFEKNEEDDDDCDDDDIDKNDEESAV